MRLLAFSIRDAKAEAFMRPFFASTRGLAIRAFVDLVNSGNGEPVAKHPDDFALFCIGEFDELTGELVKLEQPVSLGIASTFKESGS